VKLSFAEMLSKRSTKDEGWTMLGFLIKSRCSIRASGKGWKIRMSYCATLWKSIATTPLNMIWLLSSEKGSQSSLASALSSNSISTTLILYGLVIDTLIALIISNALYLPSASPNAVN